MPSKRQPAKQRRAAENRAKREALAARSEHASQPRAASPPVPSRSSGSSDATPSNGSAAAPGLGGGWAGWKQWLGVGPGAQRGVGVRAAFIALVFAIAAFAATPFIPVPVDDRDEQLPVAFRGLYLETRSILSGEEVESHNISLLDASGPGVLLYLAIPLLVIVGVFVTFRRTGRSLPLTIGMLALAVLVLLAGSIYFLPSMIALAIGSFQVRRVEMAGRVAERAAKTADDTPADEDYDDDLEDEDYDDDLEDELDDENEDDDEYEDDDEEVDADAEDDESDDIDDESDEYEDEDDESDDAGESDLDEESKPRQ